jgi:serine/threonine-protein kinase
VRQVVFEDPAPPSRLNSRCPRDLEVVCLKCLHKEPGRRYRSAQALAEDLDRFLAGEAIVARPERWSQKLARRVRRRPGFTAVLAGSAVIIAALLAGAVWLLAGRADVERRARLNEAIAADEVGAMEHWLRKADWPQATAAVERAGGRLGSLHSPDLQGRLDQGRLDLEFAARVARVRLDLALGGGKGIEKYPEAFRQAGFGEVGDDAATVAQRVRRSNVRQAVVDALDDWATWIGLLNDEKGEAWLLDVTRQADPDPQGWRDRLRDPKVRKNKQKVLELTEAAQVDRTPVNLLVALGEILDRHRIDPIPFLVRVERRYPNDFYVHYLLGLRAKQPADSVRHYQAARTIRPNTPVIEHNLGGALIMLALDNQKANRPDESARYFDEALFHHQEAVRLVQDHALFRYGLGRALWNLGRQREAIEQFNKGLALKPDLRTLRAIYLAMRDVRLYQQRWAEAHRAWTAALVTVPDKHEDWYGFAELSLFLGDESLYARTRFSMLLLFDKTTDPQEAERLGRACLLRPAKGKTFRQAVALAERSADGSKISGFGPYSVFVRGLADYRQGRFKEAAAAMRGEASKVLGPAPRLVLAMSLHQGGQPAEARKAFAQAILSHDWSPARVRDQNDWIYHVLRREAEQMLLPKLSAFLEGKHQPKDNDERLALTGACQFLCRHRAAARLYDDAFAADPNSLGDFGVNYAAARSAAQAGCGLGADAGGATEAERTRWRKQALQRLRAGLDAAKALADRPENRLAVRSWLRKWQAEPDLACLREPAELEKLGAEERKQCRAFWDDVAGLLARAER